MSKWIDESVSDGLRYVYGLKQVMYQSKSKWQTVDLVDTVPFGRALLLDGLMQSSEVDEFIYHESLVHPAMLAHPNPKNVFIGGGGEGATAREVLRHKSVEKCVMVDIDGEVVDFCKEHLPNVQEAFADPRLDLIIDDAKVRLEGYPEGFFDVIIMDLDDPLEGGPCFTLYTQSFYETVKSKLSPNGVFVTQTSSGGVTAHRLVFSPVHNTLKQVFPSVMPYNQAVLSFCDEWSWNMAFVTPTATRQTAEEIDAAIEARITGGAAVLRFLDGQSYQGLFALSKSVRKTLAEETRVLSLENPAFFFGKGIHKEE